jgi:UDPglucose 6-dehydrogenase
MGKSRRSPFQIVEAVLEANARQMEASTERILSVLPSPQGKTAAFLGLAFKPNTDDMRESPALRIIPALQARGVKIRAYDPAAMANAHALLNSVEFCAGVYEACLGAHAVVLLTEWNEFRSLDLKRLRSLVAAPAFADLRNVYEPSDIRGAGFDYVSVGRSKVL